MIWRFRLVLALCLLTLGWRNGQAHLLPAQNGTMNIIDSSAFLVVSVPVSALKAVDSNADGVLSSAETLTGNDAIISQFNARFQMTDRGHKGEIALSWVVPPQADHQDVDATYLVIMQRINFPTAITRPIITTDLFGSAAGEGQMTLTATANFEAQGSVPYSISGTSREVAILKPGAEKHQFFRGPTAIFIDYVELGIAHIWSGIDHLLFVLSIIVVAASWRYWLVVITSFTIAHSITLVLSALNLVRIPVNIIEPSIAASLVLMALLNLHSLSAKTAVPPAAKLLSRAVIVFACGLLHGFGFASAIGELALDSKSQFATLAGFNLGIEFGQLMFVGAMLAFGALLGKLKLLRVAAQIPRIASYLVLVFGLVFFVTRLAVF